jgi:hypothetical protein
MRVCPFCGEPPGAGVFCEACGRNLAGVEQLPTRAEWEAGRPVESPESLQQRCAEATAAFLTAMRAAGSPGTVALPSGPPRAFRRPPTVEGWIVRAVQRDEEELTNARLYAPGLFLSVEGAWYQLDNEVRGWGQRDFPQFAHTIGAEPIEALADARVVAELAKVLKKQGVGRDG